MDGRVRWQCAVRAQKRDAGEDKNATCASLRACTGRPDHAERGENRKVVDIKETNCLMASPDSGTRTGLAGYSLTRPCSPCPPHAPGGDGQT